MTSFQDLANDVTCYTGNFKQDKVCSCHDKGYLKNKTSLPTDARMRTCAHFQ